MIGREQVEPAATLRLRAKQGRIRGAQERGGVFARVAQLLQVWLLCNALGARHERGGRPVHGLARCLQPKRVVGRVRLHPRFSLQGSSCSTAEIRALESILVTDVACATGDLGIGAGVPQCFRRFAGGSSSMVRMIDGPLTTIRLAAAASIATLRKAIVSVALMPKRTRDESAGAFR
jgi:hypothetical protein